MYVLIDMEWVTNRHGNHWPTQLAAIRVDEEWQTVDSFSVLFRPKDITFQKWDHMAFSGWTRDNFLNADSLYPALDAFEHWLQPEDILCWWHQEAYDLYIMFTKVAQIRDRVSMVVFLSDYIYGFLAGQKGAVGSPYKICAARDITTPEPAHCSINDVLAIQSLVQSIDFQQRNLQAPPKKWVKDTTALKGSPVFPLLYDTSTQLIASCFRITVTCRHTLRLRHRSGRGINPAPAAMMNFWMRFGIVTRTPSPALITIMCIPSSPRCFIHETAPMCCYPLTFRVPYPMRPA